MALVHPALMKSSGWKYSTRLRDIFAAKWYGCPSPAYFDGLEKEERIDILAAYEVDWRITAINTYEQQQEAQRESKKSRARPSGRRRR